MGLGRGGEVPGTFWRDAVVGRGRCRWHRDLVASPTMPTWFQTYRGVVHPWMCDQFGHLNVRFYAHVFDDSGFALWPMAGVGRLVFERLGVHTVVARTETDFRAELPPGRFIAVQSRFEAIGDKSVRYVQQLRDADTEQLHAEQRVVEVFFDPQTRRACPMPEEIRRVLEPLAGD